MKIELTSILVSFLFFFSCATWKASINTSGNYETGILNAIIDFNNTIAYSKYDTSFSIDFKDFNSELLGVSICGTVGKFIVTEDGKSSRIPTRYYEYNEKLFYWYDEKHELNIDVVNKLNQYNLIDSVKTIAQAEFVIDDAKKGVDYYLCKKNLSKYKKVKTTKALGYYEPPHLNCNY